MNQSFWIGVGTVVGTAVVGWIAWFYTREKDLESEVVVKDEMAKDAKIEDTVHRLSDAELDALYETELRKRTDKS